MSTNGQRPASRSSVVLDVLDSAPVEIAILSADGESIVYANDAYRRRLERGSDDADGAELQRVTVDRGDGAPGAVLLLGTGGGRFAAALEETIVQKELLLDEMNHRVKNSVQMVSALLGLQARSARDDVSRKELESAARRLHAISSLHERLYTGGNGGTADFGSYLRSLCDELAGSSPRHRCQVVAEPIALPADTATRLGLAFVELATNAMKHANAPEDRCVIDVRFGRTPDGRVELVVRDYGVGLPDGFSPGRASGGLGMRVIRGMAIQMSADLAVENASPGARWTIRLPADAGHP